MNNIQFQNYQQFYRSFYQNNNLNQNNNYSFLSANNGMNHSFFQNNNAQMIQSPSSNVIFQVPKQNEISNFHYTPRTPSPSHNRRNFVDLNDNSKFKEVYNSPIFYKKFPGIDSFKKAPQIYQNHFRNMSPSHINLRKNSINNFEHFVPNSPIYINMNQKLPRLARTPEPRNNNLNIINFNNNSNSISNSNNNNHINYYSGYSKYGYNPLSNFKNSEILEIEKQNYNKQIFNGHNYLSNNNNLNINKVNDENQNNNSIGNNENINAINYKQYRNIISKKINNIYHNYPNNINIKKINGINQNHQYFNNISFIKNNNNSQNNKYNINIIKNIEISQNPNYLNIKKVNNFENTNNQGSAYQNSSKGSSNALNSRKNQNVPPNIPPNHINIISIPHNKYISNFGENGKFRRSVKEIIVTKPTPSNDFNISEFKILKKIGEGTFGKIYCVRWNRNNELYALKKLDLFYQELDSFKKKVKIVQDLVKKTGHNGYIKIYGDKIVQRTENIFHYYIIMELGDRDWEKEIIMRKTYSSFYTEYELFQIIMQLIKSLALMQKNNVTHRDIKPQNILLCQNIFKICDFDEAKVIEGNGLILQPVRGSELYMSPILFYAYNSQVINVLHNTYKSDVFSLGMTILLAAALSAKPLCDIRELKDMNVISQIINDSLNSRYSPNIIKLIIKMLQLDENLRADFIDLETYISNLWPS